jgi:hypothetical protein
MMNRRAFLKMAALALAAAYSGLAEYSRAAAYSADDPGRKEEAQLSSVAWPRLLKGGVPQPVREILGRVPPMSISSGGILSLQDGEGRQVGNVPLARTQWNKEKSSELDRLMTECSWGIVLHWYGEPDYFDKTVTGYLRGFDGLREANGYETRTSAHFLVGDALPVTQTEAQEEVIGVLQTQAPDKDGTPFVASHLRSLDYKQFRERQQYFVKAWDALEYADQGDHSILQDFYDGPKIDPGWRTIAIEITGYNFDNPETMPGAQKIANVLGVVWAVMKRYKISALDVLGHHEISLDKSDPGKLFMETIRYLLGVKALLETDEEMKGLVFGRFLEADDRAPHLYSQDRLLDAVGRYFQFLRDYLVLVSRPTQVYAWERRSQYWRLFDQLPEGDLPAARRRVAAAGSFCFPLDGKISLMGDVFLKPDSHAGVDLYPEREQVLRKLSGISEVKLAADGLCLYVGKNAGGCAGKMAIFRHREPEGAEILTIYSHMSELADLQAGAKYSQGTLLGRIASPQVFMERYLHFAVAYGATWETDLSQGASLPLNAQAEWIKQRFIEPFSYIKARI